MSRAVPRNRHACWTWLLVLAVLTLRAAVPQGFMPEQKADGTLTLTVCGSGGLVHIPLQPDAPRPKGTPSHCAFAGIGPADLPPPLVLPDIAWAVPEYLERNEAAQRATVLYPRPPSRAPPVLA